LAKWKGTMKAFILKAYIMANGQVFWLTSFLAPSHVPKAHSGKGLLKNAIKAYSFRKSSGFAPDSLLMKH